MRRPPLFRFLCGLLLCQGVLILGIAQTPPASHADRPGGANRPGTYAGEDTPEAMLKLCARYADGLNPTDRAFLMFRVADAAAKHQFAESTVWARRAFSVAGALPKNWNRMALQKNALLALDKTRPLEALQLLGTIEGPDFTSGTRVPEDPRADAAQYIFVDAYKAGGKSALQSLDEVSRYLAQTGEYPYDAWGNLLSTFLAADPDGLRQELTTAIFFYNRAEGRIRTQDGDYLEMAEAVQNVAPASEMKNVVEAGIGHLEEEKPPDNETLVDRSGPPVSRVSFNDRSYALLYRWLQLAQKFDPELYQSVEKKDGALLPKTQGPAVTGEIIGDKSAISSAARQRIADRMQEVLVVEEASNAPELAMADANKITSSAIRSDALAQAALAVTDENALWRGKFLAASKSALDDSTPKDASYLHALADLTASCDHLGMKEEALAGVMAGLDLGIEIVSESADGHPESPTMLLEGYADLAHLVATGMRLDSRPTLRTVRNLPDGAVKLNLMVDIADSLASKPAAPA